MDGYEFKIDGNDVLKGFCTVHKRELEERFFCPDCDNSGWISVKERLPEKDGYWLTWTPDWCESEFTVAQFHSRSKTWSAENYGTMETRFIKAWQPLPAPPKGE